MKPVRHRLAAILASVALACALPSHVQANDPYDPDDNPGEPTDAPFSNSWSAAQINSGPSHFKWDSSVASWLKPYMKDSLEVYWPDASANNSDSIRFLYVAGGSATVLHTTTTTVDDCNAVQWQGCAVGAGTWTWKIWIRKSYYTWCENNPNGDPCRHVQRVMVHEMGHVGGFLGHNNDAQANTIMQAAGAPWSYQTGGTRKKLQLCDEARMQMLYDVNTFAGPYADCFKLVPNAGAEGMKTVITASPASSVVCSGDPVNMSGRLDIYDGHYGRRTGAGTPTDPYKWKLDSNALSGRTVEIKRNGSAYTTAVANGNSGSNWSKVITLTSATTITWSFTAQFVVDATDPSSMETGLNTSGAAPFSITVVRDVDC